jgi:hypothetical protein
MRAARAAAVDVFGDDQTVNELECRAAERVGRKPKLSPERHDRQPRQPARALRGGRGVMGDVETHINH